MKRLFLLSVLLLSAVIGLRAQETYCFVQRDTCDLYLDIFRPAEGTDPTFQGIEKPTILHVFGGGFIGGQRNDDVVSKWVKVLNGEGYTVVTMDYRLGMKDYKVQKGLIGLWKASDRFYLSQQVGQEDVFEAIRFLAAHPELGIDVNNLVLAGSSAGAIITLSSVYALSNGAIPDLPEGFRLKGAISFAGAIIGVKGAPKLQDPPCPLLFMHGTADQAVKYRSLSFFGRGMWGSDFLARQFKQKKYDYCIYRFKGSTHDVAGYHSPLWPLEKQFLEENVMLGHSRVVDAVVTDPSLPTFGTITLDTLY